MTTTHPLKHIRLHLARSKDQPEGSAVCGYEFVAPLDHRGHISVEGWKEHRERCEVRRFWINEDEKIGRLVHKSGGPEGATWIFDYDEDRRDDDEAGYRFDAHAFVPGEYVTLRDQDASHTFRVVSVEGARPQ